MNDLSIIVVGDSGSGKTRLLDRLGWTTNAASRGPTIAAEVHTIVINKKKCVVWDMSGDSRYSNLWESQISQCKPKVAIIVGENTTWRNRLPSDIVTFVVPTSTPTDELTAWINNL